MNYKQLGVVTPGNCRRVEDCLLGGRREISRNKNTVQLHFQTGVRFLHMVSAKYSALSLAGKTAKNKGFQELLATLRHMIRIVSAPIFGLAVNWERQERAALTLCNHQVSPLRANFSREARMGGMSARRAR